MPEICKLSHHQDLIERLTAKPGAEIRMAVPVEPDAEEVASLRLIAHCGGEDMTRISKLDPKDWDEGLRALAQPDTATPLEQGLMRMFAHAPGIAKGLAAFGGSLKMNRSLPSRLVELVRLRVAFHNQCRSCMAIRYTDAVNAGVSEDLVCELADPPKADNLTEAEQRALHFADLFANNHLAIDDATYDELREHFTEPEIIELAMNVAFFVGFGRLAATLAMTEELPEAFQAEQSETLTPWGEASIVVR